ncbi:pentapeptide repeat-containing protein [Cyanobacterium aponinum AL20118]|uniref:Pentapeptide repeat-containing protein n=1 Tax=Cyanobacterium aponinum AL20115 TaxID=3090662 RepID=A0AAF1C5T8_9CHRO|nr:pentapeptide repeat-containing protein [Cyanobacterium aponinum]WPF87729.1 pentapeptide repeat-containing protein [Cyanobacterium aponinum AL20115]
MNKTILLTSTLLMSLIATFPCQAENIEHLNQLLQTKQCENCDLAGAGLVMINLQGANLRGANLVGANLSRADLTGADLRGANLTNASFFGANLSGANLSGANAYNTDFRNSYVQGVIIEGLDLSMAHIQGTVGIPATAASAEQFYVWGLSEDKDGNYKAAADYYSQAINLNPELAQAYLGRAVIKSRYGQVSAAIKDAETAQGLFETQNNSEGYLLSSRFVQLVKARAEAEEKDGNQGSPQFVQIVNSIAPMVLKLFLP